MTELEDLKKQVEQMESKQKENAELDKLKRRKSQLEHPKTVKFANAMGGFGRGLGKLIKGTPKAMGKVAKKLNQMDENLEKRQRAEREKLKQKEKEVKKPMGFEEAINIIP